MDTRLFLQCVFFFFNDTATTEIYTLSLHDALPISYDWPGNVRELEHIIEGAILLSNGQMIDVADLHLNDRQDRKSTRLNSSHGYISYAVFCLKKKRT